MKIAINAINSRSYGITNYTLKLVNSLLKNDPALDVTLYINAEIQERFQTLDSRCSLKVFKYKSTVLRTLFINCVLPFYLLKYDLVHSVANMGIINPFVKQVITIHDAYEIKSPERFSFGKRLYMRMVTTLAGLFSRKIITVSENTGNDIKRGYAFLTNKIVPIYSGNNFPVLPFDEVVLTKSKYILFVGTIEPGKNLVTLLNAMKIVQKEFEHYRLKVVGAKHWRESEAISRLFDDNVDFLERVSDSELADLYKNAALLVLPSFYEGFGFPVIEAMAQGCPVIAADNSAIPEAGGGAAHYFKADDTNGLAEKISNLLKKSENNSYLKSLIDECLNQASKFNWDKTAKEVSTVYFGVNKKETKEIL